MENVTDLHLNKASYFGDSGEHWERFYDQFDRFAASGMADRDALNMKIEDQIICFAVKPSSNTVRQSIQ